MSFISKWFKINKYEQIPTQFSHRQIYIWLISNDKKFAIVTKDNLKWQLPGGKPKSGEGYLTTISRELLEETGFEINSKLISKIKVFGYYNITEISEDGMIIDQFIQVRTKLLLKQDSQFFDLEPREVDFKDSVISAKFINKSEILEHISWIIEKPEFTEIQDCL